MLLRVLLLIVLFFVSGIINNLVFAYSSLYSQFTLIVYGLKVLVLIYLIWTGEFKNYKYFRWILLGIALLVLVDLNFVWNDFLDEIYDSLLNVWFLYLLGVLVLFVVFTSYLWRVLKLEMFLSDKFWFAVIEVWTAVISFYIINNEISVLQINWMKLFSFTILIKILVNKWVSIKANKATVE